MPAAIVNTTIRKIIRALFIINLFGVVGIKFITQ